MMTEEVIVRASMYNPETREQEIFLQAGEKVAIEGYEEFGFAMCKYVNYDFKKSKFAEKTKGFIVRELSTGRGIYRLQDVFASKKEALDEAITTLNLHGKEKFLKHIANYKL